MGLVCDAAKVLGCATWERERATWFKERNKEHTLLGKEEKGGDKLACHATVQKCQKKSS